MWGSLIPPRNTTHGKARAVDETRKETKGMIMAKDKMREKSAKVAVTLNADSGYTSTETHRISPEQWGRVVAILNETE